LNQGVSTARFSTDINDDDILSKNAKVLDYQCSVGTNEYVWAIEVEEIKVIT
jgi:hypothetical protein